MKKSLFLSLFALFLFFTLGFSHVFSAYAPLDNPLKILLVPGHDNEVWGAQYGNIKEADMTLALATNIYGILKTDKRFEVWITRDDAGYTKEFSDYFSLQRTEIFSFKENAKKIMKDNILNGSFIKKVSVPHISATEETSVILYGINKWANENKIDAVIHIHFNDYPRKTKWTMGKYRGFAIYTPEKQMTNSKESTRLAENIFSQLSKNYAISTYEKEIDGIVPDQNLIALGSNHTLSESVRSILIEYGYIYRFGSKTVRNRAYVSMASLTATGIKNYFFGK